MIFEDWEASQARQGTALRQLIAAELGPAREPRDTRILDAACGIGTQSLPLAEAGYQVTARDLSGGSIARLQRIAAERGLRIEAGVADMRHVAGSVSGAFDVVLALDNSVPHLLTDSDIQAAFEEFRSVLKPGGLGLCSVRDYDQIAHADAVHPYGERRTEDGTFRVRQEWTWDHASPHYDLVLVVEKLAPGVPEEILSVTSRYYAVSTSQLLTMMAGAGFKDCRRLDQVIYQPILIGRA